MSLILSRSALQSARDQLYQLKGDVSLIDNALQLATDLRLNAALAKDRPRTTSLNEMQMPPANTNTPAGSLLARGSAVDLLTIQDGVKLQDNWDLHLTARAGQHTREPWAKRRRFVTADNLRTQHHHGSDLQSQPRRRTSRDAMPPPSEYPPKNHPLSETGQWPAYESQSPPQFLMKALDTHGSPRERTTVLHSSTPIRGETSGGYEPLLVPNGNYPTTSRSIWEPDNDGELDRALRPSMSGIRSSGLTGHPITRLTLPPSTPAFQYTTPRRRVGISANARTSQPQFLTPESSSSLQERIDHRNPGRNSQTVASRHFSNKGLPSFPTVQRPYTHGMAFSTVPQRITSSSKPGDLAQQNFSWLPPLRGQVERHDQPHTKAGELEGISEAYRRPGGPRQSIHQPPSLNSFSFTNKPHIGSDTVGRTSDANSVNHGRRAVRR